MAGQNNREQEAERYEVRESPLSYGAKFKLLKRLLPNPKRTDHPDPRQRWWKDVDLTESSKGRLSTGYLSQLNKDEIEQPGLEKLALIAEIMGFPVEFWLLEPAQWESKLGGGDQARQEFVKSPEPSSGHKLVELVEHLFASIPNPHTSEPYTNQEISARSNGRLTDRDVADIREQRLADPTRSQLLGLCEAFGVPFSFFAGPAEQGPLLDQEALEYLQNAQAIPLLQKSHGLSEEHMDIVIALTEQLAKMEALQGEEDT